MRKFFFAKILKMTQYTSLPNLVRLGQWEQVSEYIHRTTTTGENRARRPDRLRKKPGLLKKPVGNISTYFRSVFYKSGFLSMQSTVI